MTEQATATEAPVLVKHGNAYNIFILVLTIFSLADHGPAAPAARRRDERQLLPSTTTSSASSSSSTSPINLRGAKPKRGVLHRRAGLARPARVDPELRASSRSPALLRLARLSRLARITRLLRGQAGKDLVADVAPQPQPVRDLHHDPGWPGSCSRPRASWSSSSRAVAGRQHHDRRRRPVVGHRDDHHRRLRRLLPRHDARADRPAVFVMFAGVGIIGALASILASILVPPPKEKTAEEIAAEAAADAAEVAAAGRRQRG